MTFTHPPLRRPARSAPARSAPARPLLPLPTRLAAALLGVFIASAFFAAAVGAQERGNPEGEWRYQSGDAWGTRSSTLDQVHAGNFDDLEIAWVWRGDNYGPKPSFLSKSTPSYIDGLLYTVVGYRRTVVAMDPATGETVWTYREPTTRRWEESMRSSYGKGVGHEFVDGRLVIYVISPAFFLHAFDGKTGEHLEGFGKPVPLEGFPKTGVVDLLADFGHNYDPYEGLPPTVGYITSSSPPIVVNGTVVVGNSHAQGYHQTRIENIPGDILAYDAKTGAFQWKFRVIPKSEDEFGMDTWENDAWRWTGDVSSWAPLSADLERGIVYIPTNAPTIDFYGGFRPGDNLFGTSVIALDTETGERVWHFQTTHHPIWNYDLPNVPILADVTVEGKSVPMAIQTTKQGLTFSFDRETGEPVWPIEERPVPQSIVPGEKLSETQPFPTVPEPLEPLDLSADNLIDYTPELRQQALEITSEYRIGGPYMPPVPKGYDEKKGWIACGSTSGVNITHPAALDPTTGILYQSSGPNCSGRIVQPGVDADADEHDCTSPGGKCTTIGETVSDWVNYRTVGVPGPDGLPIYKPPYSRVTAIDMNTGEHLWWFPVGEPNDRIKDHPALAGQDLSKVGGQGRAILMVSGDLLLTNEGMAGPPVLNAHDKRTGEAVGSVKLPAPAMYGMMTYRHDGRQYIVAQIGRRGRFPESYVALALPKEAK